MYSDTRFPGRHVVDTYMRSGDGGAFSVKLLLSIESERVGPTRSCRIMSLFMLAAE